MIDSVLLCKELRRRDFQLYTGVPCSYFRGAVAALSADPGVSYVPAANEGAALAIAAGGALTRTRSVVLLQNSGLGNLVNPLTSLSSPYGLPSLLLISWRGCPDDPADEPQHAVMGATTPALLSRLGVEHRTMPGDIGELADTLDMAERDMDRLRRPVALLVRRGTLTSAPDTADDPPGYSLRRGDVIRGVLARLGPADAVVSTTGFTSRELFAIEDRPANFYMQGSMGHAIAIALGAALTRSDRRFVVLDGDGAALAHLGTLSTVGACAPENLVHVVLDNESYDSTGDQDSTSATTDLAAVARACGYHQVHRCTDEKTLWLAVDCAMRVPGPTFLHVKVARGSAAAPPRVTTAHSPADVATRFSHAMGPS